MPKLKKLTCARCPGKKFSSQSALTMHFKAVHAQPDKPTIVPKKRGFFAWLFGRKKTEQPNAHKR